MPAKGLPRGHRRRLRRIGPGRRLLRRRRAARQLQQRAGGVARHGLRFLQGARVQPDSGFGWRRRIRGGLGIRRRYEILADEVQYAQYGDRFRFQPDGLFGGEPGAAASCNIERDGEITELACKESAWLHAGDVLTVSTGGGGGYGAPDGRSAERIDDDATQRRISARPESSLERLDAEIAK